MRDAPALLRPAASAADHDLLASEVARQRGAADTRLGPLLTQIFAFSGSRPWTIAELLGDAARADRVLWGALDAIVGRGDPGISLGRWLERHDGVAADGFRLTRIKREGNAWLYAVLKVESGELSG